MWLSMVLTCLCLWLTPADPQETEHEPLGALIVPGLVYYPSRDTLCLHGLYMKSVTQLTVSILSLNETQSLYPDLPVNSSVYQCMSFQVPAPADGHQEMITIKLRAIGMGDIQIFYTEAKVKVELAPNQTFVQTDQLTYKPGQLVSCRIVKMDYNYTVFNESITNVTLWDPKNNKIGQWLSVPNEQGIAEITYQLDSDCLIGIYSFITTDRWDSKDFYVEDSVLPVLEANITSPTSIFMQDQSFTIQVCCWNVYGQSVQGTVSFNACQDYNYRSENQDSLCYESSAHTDTSGCLTVVIDTYHFKLTNSSYSTSIYIEATFVEDGTGVKINATSKNIQISPQVTTIAFMEIKRYYQQGVPYTGKVVLKDVKGNPLPYNNVTVTISYYDEYASSSNGYTYLDFAYITDANGESSFSINISAWSKDNSIYLKATHNQWSYRRKPDEVGPVYGTADATINELYSYTNSTISIRPAQAIALCGQVLDVYVDYTMSSEDLKNDSQSINFYYLVLAKDGLVGSGMVSQLVQVSDPQGYCLISLSVDIISPFAWLVVYMINSKGAVAADSTSFSVFKCLRHKVSMKFQEDQVPAGTDATLELEANPGSLCALRAVDETALPGLYQFIDDVPGFEMFNNRRFTYSLYEPDPCMNIPVTIRRNPFYFPFNPYRRYNYYIKRFFQVANLQMSSNLLTEAPLVCVDPNYATYRTVQVPSTTPPVSTTVATTTVLLSTQTVASTNAGETMPTTTVATTTQMTTPTPEKLRRRLFSDTWLWKQISLDSTGIKAMKVTTPDAIRNWRAMAFCIGDDGLGVSEIANLTTFKLFSTGMSVPYSVVPSLEID